MLKSITAAVLLLLWPAIAVLAGAAEPTADAGQGAFTYRTPQGIVWEVTADGLSSIRVGERRLAHGTWSVFNAEPWFKDAGSGAVDVRKVLEKSITIVNERTARVWHRLGDVECLASYTFDGEDVLISARIENRHESEPLRVVGFTGLTFDFGRPPEGQMMVQHISYFQAHGVGLCHPGHWSKIGGSYAVDDSVGVGVSPWRTGMTRTLILWDYGSWAPEEREKSPRRRLIYFAVSPVPCRGARTFDLKLRVSTNRDWKHLLQPYREHFRRTFGEVRYQADFRWIASDYLNHSQQAVSNTNPYGFHGGFRRIDRPDGAAAFCDKLVAALKENGGQGVIVWGHGGDDPRGAMYRPDFDVLPPEVEANWPTLAGPLQQAGLKLGVCTRPRHLAVRADWHSDQILDINPDDPGHRAMLWRRFETMIGKGCTLFYLDSFGSSFEDVKLMHYLRERMGADVLTFAEHQCDAILPYSGGYSETTYTAAGPDRPAGYRLWSDSRQWEIYRWLAPGSQMVSRLYRVEGELPADFESAESYFFRNRITPLLPVSEFGRIEQCGALQSSFVDPRGKWLHTGPVPGFPEDR
ncbi:MAG: hypothetical protein JXB62_19885 [Pirellulales bacterium]|nr:hypothetical protein [Pirellulales bacterium]